MFAAAGVMPASAAQEQDIIDGITEFNLEKTSSGSIQEWIDGDLSASPESSSEWYVMALSRYGNYDFSKYQAALLNYLSENEVASASSRQKFALVLAATGSNNRYISDTLDNSIGEQGIMSWIFALHLMNNGYESRKYSLSDVKNELLAQQTDDGGWAVTGTYSDTDTTAMAVQALAMHYQSDAQVKSAVDKAVKLLSDRQNGSGDYSSYGVNNPESTAQVLIAISALGIDAQKDSRFIKNGNTLLDGIELYRLADGSFCHKEGGESNGTATVQVFCAAVAYSRMQNGKSGFYVLGSELSAPAEENTQNISDEALTETSSEPATQTAETSAVQEITSVVTVIDETVTKTVTDVSDFSQEKEESDGGKMWIYAASAATVVAVCAVTILIKKT